MCNIAMEFLSPFSVNVCWSGRSCPFWAVTMGVEIGFVGIWVPGTLPCLLFLLMSHCGLIGFPASSRDMMAIPGRSTAGRHHSRPTLFRVRSSCGRLCLQFVRFGELEATDRVMVICNSLSGALLADPLCLFLTSTTNPLFHEY